MLLERIWKPLLVVLVVAVAGVLLVQAGVVSAPWGASGGDLDADEPDATVDAEDETADDGDDANDADDGAEVRVLDENGDPKAVVDVEVADTRRERYTGLSDHESLEFGEGMLFVHSDEDERTYVMREMDFDIDIVFVDADREITTIEHARAPEPGEDGEDLRYSGRARYVLEVPRGYANETGMAEGDEVELDY